MTDPGQRRDAGKSRQELLDELYYLRDVAGERGQQRDDAIAVLHRVVSSRWWRWTQPLRGLRHREEHRSLDQDLTRVLGARESAAPVPQAHVRSATRLPTPPAERKEGGPYLFVDVTETALRNGVTGVQRVVREIARALLTTPPEGYTVKLVCAPPGQPYRHVDGFAASLVGHKKPATADAPMAIRRGDVFLGLDHAMGAVVERAAELAAMRKAGVTFWFVLNDTLPLSRPDWFPSQVSAAFRQWFETIVRLGDGIACISRATQADVEAWLDRLQVPREARPELRWFHLGADGVAAATDKEPVATEQPEVLARLRDARSFLVVGTLEPRKGHAQTLEAFNQLWATGEDVTLVLVGRPGWMTEVVQRRIRHHDAFGERLFWFMDADDALLDRLYAGCTALLASSEGEGFGLPLVEAARHGLPILCRDLPVFREVAGEHATYFSGEDAQALADAVRDWLLAFRRGTMAPMARMPWLNWSQSAAQLMDAVLQRQSANTAN